VDKHTPKRVAYRAAKRYIHWVDGFSYDFAKNGEEWLMGATSGFGFKTVFDVGANIGSWTRSALGYFQAAEFHCFELSSETFATLQENLNEPRVHLNNFGLSDSDSEVEYKNYGRNSGVNTLLLNAEYHDRHQQPELAVGGTRRGDSYCEEVGVEVIDFLKVDVEGAEHLVFRGFHGILSQKKIRLIQFEYGYTHADAKFLMRDFFELFESYGYVVGKLRRGRVELVGWSYRLNDFDSGPNFVAVRDSDVSLIRTLTSR
jgi:FkbM family methyltransferase